MFTKFKNAAQNLTSRSLQRKMLLIFTVMLVIPVVLVSYFSYNSSSRQLELKMQESMHTSVDLLAAGIYSYLPMGRRVLRNIEQIIREEVAASVVEISNIARTTSDAFQSVTAATQEQLASMDEITASSGELSKMASDLQVKIERFKLEE